MPQEENETELSRLERCVNGLKSFTGRMLAMDHRLPRQHQRGRWQLVEAWLAECWRRLAKLKAIAAKAALDRLRGVLVDVGETVTVVVGGLPEMVPAALPAAGPSGGMSALLAAPVGGGRQLI